MKFITPSSRKKKSKVFTDIILYFIQGYTYFKTKIMILHIHAYTQ